MVVGGLHQLELQLVFFLKRYWPERRNAKKRRNVCFHGDFAVIIVRLSSVKDVSVRLGRRYVQTCSDNYLLGYRFQRGHAIRKLRDETIGSGWRWRAGICGQRWRSTADWRLWRRRWWDRRCHFSFAAVILILLIMQHMCRLYGHWITMLLRGCLWHIRGNTRRRRWWQ